MKTIILDPGHGQNNRVIGRYDPGFVVGEHEEATIALGYANEIRSILQSSANVVRTRAHAEDPAHVSERAKLARKYNGVVMLSLHCNYGGGCATGTEVFFRGKENAEKARSLSAAVAKAFGIPDRGAKTESASQHKRLAVMGFQPCFLLELGFLDNAKDRNAILDPDKRLQVAEVCANFLLQFV